VVWIGLIWLRTGTSDGLCEHDNEPSSSIRLRAHMQLGVARSFSRPIAVLRPHVQLNSCFAEFGILANKWRILHRPLDVGLEFCDSIIKACCALHNYVRKNGGVNFEDTLYECPLQSLNPSNIRAVHHGLAVRDHFTNYFTSPAGSIHWQYDKV
jgi:hypothetical protein